MDVFEFGIFLSAIAILVAILSWFFPKRIKPACPKCGSTKYGIEETKNSVIWREPAGANPQRITPEEKIAIYLCKNPECNFSTEKWI